MEIVLVFQFAELTNIKNARIVMYTRLLSDGPLVLNAFTKYAAQLSSLIQHLAKCAEIRFTILKFRRETGGRG